MNLNFHRRAPRGFTLVELLVVISIIVVLAALSFGAAQVAIKKGNTVKSKNDATALAMAFDQYYQEYSKLPTLGDGMEELRTEGEVGIELLEILLGKEDDTGTMQNPRKIPFLSVGTGKTKKKGGLIYSKDGQIEGMYDAWGNAYYVKLDIDFEDEIIDPLQQGNVVRDKKIIVYSYGADEKITGDDNVKTW